MRLLIVGLLLTALLLSGTEASAQQTDIAPFMSLNGTWSFKTLKSAAEIPASVHPDSAQTQGWARLPVPGNWDVNEAYSEFRGLGLYRREVFIPKELEKQNLRICFEAVYETAKIYVNGNYVGQHRGGYTPFEFAIDDLLRYGKNNTIAIVADNTYSRGAWWAWGGISRNVSIRGSMALRLTEIAISPTTNLQSKQGQVKLRYQLQSNDQKARKLRIQMRVRPLQALAGTFQADSISVRVEIPAGARRYEGNLSLSLAGSIQLWHFDFPNLYHCELSVYEENELLSRKESRFGFRKVEVKDNQLFLNGEAVRLFGFNRVHDHRQYGNTEPFALIKQDIDHMKSLGCNMTRMMHAPLSAELLNYADSVGMLLIEEIPVWGREDPHAFEDSPVAKQWLREMVTRDYNHPSIIGWSVANELVLDIKDWRRMRMSKEQYRYVTSMLRYVKEELDSTRLVTYVSLSAFREEISPDEEPAEYADIICFNNYGDFVKAAGTIHQRWPDKTVLVTEFGQGQIGEGIECKLDDGVLDKLKNLAALKYVAGASLWAYNDYRSNYPGTPASGNRTWGVVDAARKEKKAAQQIRKAFAPVAAIKAEWNAARKTMQVEIQPRKAGDLPSFALRQYRLRMQLLTKDEKIIGQVSPGLPDVMPGQAPLRQDIVYRKSIAQVYKVRIQLLNPMGYAVGEETIVFIR